MTTLFAQPYDLAANGFYFECREEYEHKANALLNDYGQPVEEFEIQFIDGDDIDCALSRAVGLTQGNAARFLEVAEEWEEDQKIRYILAVGECGYDFDLVNDDPSDLDVDIYEVETMRELAEQFVDEGLCGEIPDSMRFYFDYDAYARDLAMDYSETTINGSCIIYRCG